VENHHKAERRLSSTCFCNMKSQKSHLLRSMKTAGSLTKFGQIVPSGPLAESEIRLENESSTRNGSLRQKTISSAWKDLCDEVVR
jgi:hypothetical protein